MRDDDATIRDFRRALRQYRGNVFVREAVKAIAPYALLVERVRQREGLLDLRRGPVEGGVKASDLRQFGIEGHRHLDRREIVRLVQWRERYKRLQFGQQFGGYAGRPRVTQAAVDDAVAERVEPPVSQPLPDPRQYRRKHLARHRRRFRPQVRGRDGFAIGTGGARLGPSPDPVDLTRENPALALIKAEFE